MEAKRPFVSRRFRINRQDFENTELAPFCPGCSAIIRGAPAMNHSEDCRVRVELELERIGDPRVANSAIRVEEHQAEKRKGRSG